MVEIKGIRYDKIVADVNDVIDALWQEADVLRNMKTNDDEVQNNVKSFLDAIEVIKKHYYDVYKSNKDSLVCIEINGFFCGASFWARGRDIINSLYVKFCMCNPDLIFKKYNNSMNVFNYHDTVSPYFDRPEYKSELISKDKTVCDVYKAVEYLYIHGEEYDNYIKEASKTIQEDKCNILIKR